MGIRETFSAKPRVAVGVSVTFCALAAVVAVAQVFDFDRALGGPPGRWAYYTVDDGQTWFVDESSRVPPFEHEGKPAVRAYVYKCGGKKVVGHLERYTADGIKAMEQLRKVVKTGPPDGRLVQRAQGMGRELKRPGDSKWVRATDLKTIQSITDFKCPGGGEGELMRP